MTETTTEPSERYSSQELRPLTAPVLVSALANLVAGYLWFTVCFGVFLTAPMLVLCAFEFIYFAQASRMPHSDLVRRTTALGIFEILIGVFNGVSLVCGILVLIQLNRFQDRGRQASS